MRTWAWTAPRPGPNLGWMTSSQHRLSPARYREHLASESARFREVLVDADPSTRVPACPDWDVADLLWHLGGEVQAMWAAVVQQRPRGPEDQQTPVRPDSYADLLDAFDTATADLQAALASADPAEEAWTWSEDHTVAFILRRQALEAQVHRLDAEQAVGAVTPLDPELSADGVQETLDVMYGGSPPWGSFTPDGPTVRWDLTDTGVPVWIQTGHFAGTDPSSGRTYADEDDIAVCPDPGTEPDAVVAGPAADVHAWIWKRGGAEALTFSGDPAVLERVTAILSQPLN